MAQVLTGASHRQELVNVIRAGAPAVADEAARSAARIIIVVGALAGARARVLRPAGLQVQPDVGHGAARRDRGRSSSALLAFWLLRPLRKRVTDQQVALYVEEHEPSLQAAILSAVRRRRARHEQRDRGCAAGHRRPDDRAGRREGANDRGRQDRRPVARSSATRVALGDGRGPRDSAHDRRSGVPAAGRVGAARRVDGRAEAASPYAITVTPGDVHGAERIGSDDQREARGLPIERSRR